MNLREFTKKVLLNSEELMNNINYFERKIHMMQPGEADMMVFFNLEDKYANLKTQS